MADTPITSVTSHASLRHPESTFNQVMSLELSPALRAIRPDSSTEQSSGIEGDGLLQLERDLPARTAVTDTPSSLNDGADGHETESPAYAVEKIPACLKKTSRNQKANQRLGSEGVGSKDTIKMNEPVATRTRRSTKLQHPSTAEKTKNITGKLQMETEENMKSILLQLRQQNQQQQDRLTEMNVMLKNVLELQLLVVHELRKDVEAELQSKEKLPLPGPELVNSRTATNEIGADTTEASSRPFKQNVTHASDGSTAKCYFARTLKANTTENIEILPTSAMDDSMYDESNSSCNIARLCMATQSRPTNDASNSSGDSDKFASPDQSRSEASSRLVSSDKNRRSTRNKSRESYTVPIESNEVREEANSRLAAAMNQVPLTTHSDPNGKKCEATLYLGNLEYAATEEQLRDSLKQYFKRIKVQEIVIPTSNGRSRGYAFVTLAWAQACNLKPSDLCDYYSGMLDVNSRPIYLRELRRQNMKSSTRAMATGGIAPPSPDKEQLKRLIAARDKELEQLELQRQALNTTSEDEAEFGGLSDSSME